ncbi:hypothetical protein SB5439_04965 [Klebsiella variicola]|uniref:hypothetical protein n=1 Tax=Klebsiella variicola TaxID=244366 RepID=UPI00109CE62A|nr:hypothetical protein [Klebsiella variicola]VGQ11558.1 hypothetical protein SB5439_04965 [Klebsiella variicola]
MPYRRAPAARALDKWHKALNNGHRFAVVDAKNNIVECARDEWRLKALVTFRPDLRIIIIADMLKG